MCESTKKKSPLPHSAPRHFAWLTATARAGQGKQPRAGCSAWKSRFFGYSSFACLLSTERLCWTSFVDCARSSLPGLCACLVIKQTIPNCSPRQSSSRSSTRSHSLSVTADCRTISRYQQWHGCKETSLLCLGIIVQDD